MVLVDLSHAGGHGEELLVDEDEDRLLRGHLDTLADDVEELADGEVVGDKVLLLLDLGDVRLGSLLRDDGDAVRVALTNTRRLRVTAL